MWHNDFKVPNGVHVWPAIQSVWATDYPFELKKTREMTVIRDQAIWATLAGKAFDVAAADAKTSKLPKVNTNYNPSVRTVLWSILRARMTEAVHGGRRL